MKTFTDCDEEEIVRFKLGDRLCGKLIMEKDLREDDPSTWKELMLYVKSVEELDLDPGDPTSIRLLENFTKW